MKTFRSTCASATLVLLTSAFLSISTYAAKPTSITFESEGSTEAGEEFAIYSVKCTSGEKQPITAWNQRTQWCVGNHSAENCHQRQIKAALKACEQSDI